MSEELEEKKKKRKGKKRKVKTSKGKKDACYHKVKRRYKVWPSAYASGALVKCRKVGAANWGNKSKRKNESLTEEKKLTAKAVKAIFKEKGGALAMQDLKDAFPDASEKEIEEMLDSMKDVGDHKHGDLVRADGGEIKVTNEQLKRIIQEELEAVLDEKKKRKLTKKPSSEKNLGDWFGRKGAKGSKGGWVDCNAPDGKGGYKSCGRSSGEKRKKYPACRPTPSACKSKGKGKKWGKKAARGKKEGMEMRQGFLFEGDESILEHFDNATLEEGGLACGACLFEVLQEASCGCPDLQQEAEYRGRKVKLNKPMRGDVKKFKVYVKDPKTGNIKKVNFGHGGTSAKKRGEKTMKIKKSDPKRRKSFRARHNCDNPGPKTKARYWSCRMWEE